MYSDKVKEQIIVHSDRRKTGKGICVSLLIPLNLINMIMKDDLLKEIATEEEISKHKITNEATNRRKS